MPAIPPPPPPPPSSKMASILRISIEVLETMIRCVDMQQVHLNMALTCKSLCNFIIPNHLYFRRIDTSVSNDGLLELLASHPLLATNFHEITLHRPGWDVHS
ncbi:hypothetical protein M422DRAFT_246299 [Sphaerobolus stellatus SS14]|nr:hypothetical protein M422DRAFT_246299 [Sphaerobolus stellatus SS14]